MTAVPLRVRSSRARSARAIARLVPLYLALAVLKHVVPLRLLARWAARSRPRRPAAREAAPAVIARVLRAGQLTGVPDRDCLQRSLLLYRELSRAGLAPHLLVGFKKDDIGLQGHAWVELQGAVAGEPAAALQAFVPAVRFGPTGQPLARVDPHRG